MVHDRSADCSGSETWTKWKSASVAKQLKSFFRGGLGLVQCNGVYPQTHDGDTGDLDDEGLDVDNDVEDEGNSDYGLDTCHSFVQDPGAH